jgi:hypothetical protein
MRYARAHTRALLAAHTRTHAHSTAQCGVAYNGTVRCGGRRPLLWCDAVRPCARSAVLHRDGVQSTWSNGNVFRALTLLAATEAKCKSRRHCSCAQHLARAILRAACCMLRRCRARRRERQAAERRAADVGQDRRTHVHVRPAWYSRCSWYSCPCALRCLPGSCRQSSWCLAPMHVRAVLRQFTAAVAHVKALQWSRCEGGRVGRYSRRAVGGQDQVRQV